MADESPGVWSRVLDDVLKVGVAIFDTVGSDMVKNMRHVYELVTNKAAGDTLQAIGHNHGQLKGGEDGVPIRQSLWNPSYINDTNLYFEKTIANGDGWTPIDNKRVQVGPFQACAGEVYWYATSGSGIQWRLSHADAVNNGNVTWGLANDTTHQLQETVANAPGAAAWATISGQVDAAGASGKEQLPIWTLGDDGAVSGTDFKTMLSRREFLLEAYSPVGDTVIRVYAVNVFEVMTSDDLD